MYTYQKALFLHKINEKGTLKSRGRIKNIMLKIGVLGAGYLGKIHLRCIKNISDYELVGFYDPSEENAKAVEEEFGIKSFETPEDLISEVDVVDIVSPTISHFDNAYKAIRQFKHVFIEKPIVATPEEARKLINIAAEAKVKVQVGHVERFNPAFIAAEPHIEQPMFIEAHRLSNFNPRGTDVPVVLDLMIHDIDVILSCVKANIRKISASGVAVVSDTPDIANARLEFDNGAVANLTASRISMKNMRKTRIFQRNAYLAIDFLEKSTEVLHMKDVDEETTKDPMAMVLELGEGKTDKQIIFDKPDIKPINAIQTELQSFYDAIVKDVTPVVTIEDGYMALNVAHEIVKKIGNQ
jgi:predicted dehydrogenase